MWTMFWITVAATIVGGIVLSFMLWVLKRTGWTPAVGLSRWIGKGVSRIHGRLASMGSWAVKALPPYRKHEQLQSETDSLRSEVESLQKSVQQLEEFSKNTRWLELESRRVAYVHLCRELAPHIVADSHGPNILVTLKNVVQGITDDVDGAYFYLLGPTRREPEDKPNISTWVADAKLSNLIAELFGSSETGDTHLRLGVVRLGGTEELLEVALGAYSSLATCRWHLWRNVDN